MDRNWTLRSDISVSSPRPPSLGAGQFSNRLVRHRSQLVSKFSGRDYWLNLVGEFGVVVQKSEWKLETRQRDSAIFQLRDIHCSRLCDIARVELVHHHT